MHEREYLNSWKEVAQYVGRSERTIQRWERHLGFPVHRPAGKLRSSVIGVKEEIDWWVKQTHTAQTGAPTPVQAQFKARGGPPPLVLCIDHDKSGLKVCKAFLEARGYRVLASGDGPQGVALFEQNRVDLVILEYCITAFDGEVIARMLRRRKPHVPILMLSDVEQLPATARSLVHRVVPKGNGPAALLMAIENWMHGPRVPGSRKDAPLSTT